MAVWDKQAIAKIIRNSNNQKKNVTLQRKRRKSSGVVLSKVHWMKARVEESLAFPVGGAC